MARLASAGSIIALALLTSGCPPTSGAVDDLPERLAPAYCDLLSRCGNPYLEQFLTGGGDCATNIVPLLEDTFLGRAQAAIDEGTVVYHADRVDGCLAAFGDASCDFERAAERCTDVFEGTIAAGGDCDWDEECVSGLCSMSDGSCPGTCAARVGAGEACTDSRACPIGFTCREDRCVEQAGEGDPCGGDTGLTCAGIDLNCVGSMGATPGTCRTWSSIMSGGVGDSCSLAGSMFCEAGLSCVFEDVSGGAPTYVCVAELEADAACTPGFPDPCPADQFCWVEGGLMGTCTDLPTEGQPCYGACETGLRCVSYEAEEMARCVEPRRLGASCTANDECFSNSCQDGVCANPGC